MLVYLPPLTGQLHAVHTLDQICFSVCVWLSSIQFVLLTCPVSLTTSSLMPLFISLTPYAHTFPCSPTLINLFLVQIASFSSTRRTQGGESWLIHSAPEANEKEIKKCCRLSSVQIQFKARYSAKLDGIHRMF